MTFVREKPTLLLLLTYSLEQGLPRQGGDVAVPRGCTNELSTAFPRCIFGGGALLETYKALGVLKIFLGQNSEACLNERVYILAAPI